METPNRRWIVWAGLSLCLATLAIVQTFYHNLWYDLFRPRMALVDLAHFLLFPLWALCAGMAFLRFPGARKRLWWLLLPLPFCLRELAEFLLTMFAWSTHGFAP